jgi:hypothetical protein
MEHNTNFNAARRHDPPGFGRVQRIADASICGDNPRDIATDILTDLQHWCTANGVRFGASLMRARGHFTAERIGGLAAPNVASEPGRGRPRIRREPGRLVLNLQYPQKWGHDWG